MFNFATVFAIIYECAILGAILYFFALMSRFTRAQERVADALERAAQNPRRE